MKVKMLNTIEKSEVLIVHEIFLSERKDATTEELRETTGWMVKNNDAYIEYKSYYPYNYLKTENEELEAANKKLRSNLKKATTKPLLISINTRLCGKTNV